MNTRSIQRALQAHTGGGMDTAVINQEPSMRVSPEYQAVIPELKRSFDPVDNGVGSMKVWMPTDRISEEDIDAYLVIAKDKFGYGVEQALGMLYWHDYCIEKALENMPNFCPLKDEWSMEDKVIFQQAFQYHGKNFQRIRAMLPDKPISSLVKYYYLWKRSYTQYSLMDKQARRNVRRLGAGLPVSNDDTDSNKSGSGSSRSDPHSIYPGVLYQQPLGKGKQLPRGIYLNTIELVDLSSDEDNAHIRRMDREILDLKKKLQDNKQMLVILRERCGGDDNIESFRPTDYSKKSGSNGPTRWTDDEIEAALEVIKRHGKDCEALAIALEGKTVAQCRNFFTNYKRKLNLPRLIAEYEIKNGHKLSRYGRQAKELVENGGTGLQQQQQQQQQQPQEVVLHRHQQPHQLADYTGNPIKRPRYEPPAPPSQGRGIAGYNNPRNIIPMVEGQRS